MDLLSFLEVYPNIHIIAFSGKKYVGYDSKTNKAFYLNGHYQSDLLSDMNDDYTDWAVPLLDKLPYDVGIIDNGIDYYEVIDLTVD